MTSQEQIKNDARYTPLHEYGFVGLVDVMGDDSTPPETARISYGSGTKSVSDDRNLLRYLVRHRHTTPIEMVELRFHLKMPIFVMRQHVRHRMATINEYSGRYSEMSDEMYVPDHDHLGVQSSTNKQGTEAGTFDKKVGAGIRTCMLDVNDNSYAGYKALLDSGLSRELSRCVLPVSNYTELYWKIDLHNFFHYAKLRMDPHAQLEIREYATAMYELVKQKLPIACEAFEDYIFKAHTFSRMEFELIKRMISKNAWVTLSEDYDRDDEYDNEGIAREFGMSKREMTEFKTKFGLK
jgi:thymidylate synthase (FAD)